MLKIARIDDPAYRQSFAGSSCEACSLNNGSTVPAHFPFESFTYGKKVGDDQIVGLCFDCHNIADGRTNASMEERNKIWFRVLKKRLPDRYKAFKEQREQERVDG